MSSNNTGRPKTMDSEAVLQAIETNPTRSIEEYKARLAYHSLVWCVPFMTLTKAFGTVKLCLMLPKQDLCLLIFYNLFYTFLCLKILSAVPALKFYY